MAVAAANDNRRQVQRVLLLALAVNLLLALLKLGVGLLSGSLAVLADAMHSATDGFSSLLGLFTQGLSDPRPDRDHPYGHHKYTAVGALALAAVILFAAFEILQTALLRLSSGPTPLRLGPSGLVLLLLALGIRLLLAQVEQRRGRRLGSPLLTSDALRSRRDFWMSCLVVGGLAVAMRFQLDWLDLALAIPLGLLLVKLCWQVVTTNLPWLVDQIAIAPEAIHAVVMGVPGVLNCHDIASRGVVGQQVFIDMHLVVEATDLPTAHRITELVEEHIEARFGPVRCTIHLEPPEYASAEITFRGTHG